MAGFIDIGWEPIRPKSLTDFTKFFIEANIQCIKIGKGQENGFVISKIDESSIFPMISLDHSNTARTIMDPSSIPEENLICAL